MSGQLASWKCFTGEIKGLKAKVFGAPLLPKEESTTMHNEALLAISACQEEGLPLNTSIFVGNLMTKIEG